MNKNILILFFTVCCNLIYAQDNVICSFEGDKVTCNETFIENVFVEKLPWLKPDMPWKFHSTYCKDNKGNMIKIECDTFEEEFGFYEIKISRDGKVLLNLKQEDSWTYTFKGRSTTDYSKYTSDRYYIPLMSDGKVTLIAFIGWPYGGDLPLLTIVAITDTEAKVVYNRYASIDTISKSPNLEIKLETVLVEYGEGGIPFNEQKYHWIKYRDSKLIYE